MHRVMLIPIIIFLALAILLPNVLGLILRGIMFFLSIILGVGVGLLAWSAAGCLGYAEKSMSSFLLYYLIFGLSSTIFIFSKSGA